MVDAAGKHEPLRVTSTPGFDGLASFSPDGKKLTWTSNRTADKTSQIFLCDWDDATVRTALGLNAQAAPMAAQEVGTEEISTADLKRHITYLASDELEGRLTGTKGEQLATAYVAQQLQAYGCLPAGKDGTFFAPFDFTAGVALGAGNKLAANADDPKDPPQVKRDWVPLAFSQVGKVESMGVVFAGYGMEVPAASGKPGEEYASYVHADVKDKWVMVLRYLPDGLSQAERVRFFQYSSLRRKAMLAREKGAKGLIIVSGPNAKVQDQLVPLNFDASLAGSGVAAISITDGMAKDWLAMAGKDLAKLQETLDKGDMVQGFEIPGLKVGAEIDIHQEKRTGRNVLAKIPAGNEAAAVLIGAHVDHLGNQGSSDSLAAGADKQNIHHGADDNASGVGGMLEIAQWLNGEVKSGKLKLARPILFAAWSGEEEGLLGSAAYVRELAKAKGDENAKLNDLLCANLNMDMIGRMGSSVIIQGLGSSDYWPKAIEKRNVAVGLSIQAQNDCFLPTDATSFYLRGVPIFNLFTGSHEDYHKPTDTADKINYEGTAKIAKLTALIAKDLAASTEAPNYVEQKKPQEATGRGFRVYLGTIPDYAQGDVEGVKLSGVSPTGPAAKAGVLPGDIIVKLAGKDIKNIYEYTDTMAALKIGEATELGVKRGDKVLTLKLVPGSRE